MFKFRMVLSVKISLKFEKQSDLLLKPRDEQVNNELTITFESGEKRVFTDLDFKINYSTDFKFKVKGILMSILKLSTKKMVYLMINPKEKDERIEFSNLHLVQKRYVVNNPDEVPQSFEVGTLIDNDYMRADHFNITFYDNYIENVDVFYDIYELDGKNLLSTSLIELPGGYHCPIFIKTMKDFQKQPIDINCSSDYVVEKFSLLCASKGAAGLDICMNEVTLNNNIINSDIIIRACGSIKFIFKPLFTSPLDLARTPYLFLLRSRYVLERLLIRHEIVNNTHLAVTIINNSPDDVRLKQCKRGFRIFQFHLPTYYREEVYKHFQNSITINGERSSVLGRILNPTKRLNDIIDYIENLACMESAYREILGVDTTVQWIQRQAKLDSTDIPFY
jgi:hypothetical protein